MSQRSESLPYTHASTVRSFKVVSADGQTYVVTAGADSVIRTWRFDATKSSFEAIAAMEGHIRAVTCLLLLGTPPLLSSTPLECFLLNPRDVHISLGNALRPPSPTSSRPIVLTPLTFHRADNQLWSGSLDHNIRVWDVGSGSCLGVLRAGAGGHSAAVSCLELIPAGAASGGDAGAASEPLVASGGCDCEVKVWRASGELVTACHHGAFVTSLKFFQDTNGSTSHPVGSST